MKKDQNYFHQPFALVKSLIAWILCLALLMSMPLASSAATNDTGINATFCVDTVEGQKGDTVILNVSLFEEQTNRRADDDCNYVD